MRKSARGATLRAPLVAAIFALASLTAADQNPEELLEHRLRAHVEFLADDLLAGREPGTPGYDIAAAYVASQFAQAGLTPAGVAGGWYQPVPLKRALMDASAAALGATVGGIRREFQLADEFWIGPSLAHEQSEVRAGAVFAGYGIEAKALDHDDYAQLDVKGKIVVILSGQPDHFPSEEGAHFGSYREKHRAAIRHGAIGIVRIHTPRRDRRVSWARYEDYAQSPSMGWMNADGQAFSSFPELRVNAILHHEAAAALFAGAAFSLRELIERDEAGQPLARFPLDVVIDSRQRSMHGFLDSPNVVGVLPGSDPTLADEYVVYMGHLDHLGALGDVDDPEADVIHNGALDNAAGIAVMLETARVHAAGARPRRSLLFLAVTAEEKGLVGAEYFARHPTVPADAMVAAINLDMPVLLHDFEDVIAFGAEHSNLGEAVARAGGEFNVSLSPDPWPEQSIFVRSDHYRFVQQGIPSVYLVTGPAGLETAEDEENPFQQFLEHHYHRPSDDTSLPIDYRAGARFTRINARLGAIVANRYARPRWLEGSFFGRTYGR